MLRQSQRAAPSVHRACTGDGGLSPVNSRRRLGRDETFGEVALHLFAAATERITVTGAAAAFHDQPVTGIQREGGARSEGNDLAIRAQDRRRRRLRTAAPQKALRYTGKTLAAKRNGNTIGQGQILAPDAVAALAEQIAAAEQLTLRGLMTIPAAHASTAQQQQSFAAMQRLFSALSSQYDTVDTLSMGMSQDLAAAIGAGSTMVRVGTALFGARTT